MRQPLTGISGRKKFEWLTAILSPAQHRCHFSTKSRISSILISTILLIGHRHLLFFPFSYDSAVFISAELEISRSNTSNWKVTKLTSLVLLPAILFPVDCGPVYPPFNLLCFTALTWLAVRLVAFLFQLWVEILFKVESFFIIEYHCSQLSTMM